MSRWYSKTSIILEAKETFQSRHAWAQGRRFPIAFWLRTSSFYRDASSDKGATALQGSHCTGKRSAYEKYLSCTKLKSAFYNFYSLFLYLLLALHEELVHLLVGLLGNNFFFPFPIRIFTLPVKATLLPLQFYINPNQMASPTITDWQCWSQKDSTSFIRCITWNKLPSLRDNCTYKKGNMFPVWVTQFIPQFCLF